MARSSVGVWQRLVGSSPRWRARLNRSGRTTVRLLCSELLEKLRQHPLAVLRQNPSHDVDTVVQARVAGEIEHRSAGTGLGIRCPKDEPGDPCQDDGAETHGAGLEGHQQGRINQSPSAEHLGTFPDHDEFRMRGRVLPCLPVIVRLGDDRVLMHEDGADRYFPDGGALRRLLEGDAHERTVFFARTAGHGSRL